MPVPDADPITTLLTASGGAFLGKFVGPAAEHLGKAAWERVQAVAQKAYQLLTGAGREPQPVEMKVLVPLVQAAAQETDPELADMWAALLANAADPEQKVSIRPAFIEVLGQLTPREAKLMDIIYKDPESDLAPSLERSFKMFKGFYTTIEYKDFENQDLAVAIEFLIRLRLLGELPSKTEIEGNKITFYNKSFYFTPTIFGQHFYAACSPPKA